jgi:hypothetical protein
MAAIRCECNPSAQLGWGCAATAAREPADCANPRKTLQPATMSTFLRVPYWDENQQGVVMAHRGGALALVVTIAVCSTAAAATNGSSAQKPSPTGAPHRVQVLRIVETTHAAQPGTKVSPKTKRLAAHKTIRHRPVLAHQLASTPPADIAKSSGRAPPAVKPPENADLGPIPPSVAVGKEPAATNRNAADDRTAVADPIHALMIKTQHAQSREPAQILPGATPIASSDFRTTDSQVAARWPADSELFTPVAPTYEHASFQTRQ